MRLLIIAGIVVLIIVIVGKYRRVHNANSLAHTTLVLVPIVVKK